MCCQCTACRGSRHSVEGHAGHDSQAATRALLTVAHTGLQDCAHVASAGVQHAKLQAYMSSKDRLPTDV